eukprot:GHVN01073147.1.p1 GENE.GHVN01073147.1~~GHVN01073147.1.p1  ORF type:complete len:478 (-),score=73.26 GHVN01073147.1:253-1686(-)
MTNSDYPIGIITDEVSAQKEFYGPGVVVDTAGAVSVGINYRDFKVVADAVVNDYPFAINCPATLPRGSLRHAISKHIPTKGQTSVGVSSASKTQSDGDIDERYTTYSSPVHSSLTGIKGRKQFASAASTYKAVQSYSKTSSQRSHKVVTSESTRSTEYHTPSLWAKDRNINDFYEQNFGPHEPTHPRRRAHSPHSPSYRPHSPHSRGPPHEPHGPAGGSLHHQYPQKPRAPRPPHSPDTRYLGYFKAFEDYSFNPDKFLAKFPGAYVNTQVDGCSDDPKLFGRLFVDKGVLFVLGSSMVNAYGNIITLPPTDTPTLSNNGDAVHNLLLLNGRTNSMCGNYVTTLCTCNEEFFPRIDLDPTSYPEPVGGTKMISVESANPSNGAGESSCFFTQSSVTEDDFQLTLPEMTKYCKGSGGTPTTIINPEEQAAVNEIFAGDTWLYGMAIDEGNYQWLDLRGVSPYSELDEGVTRSEVSVGR